MAHPAKPKELRVEVRRHEDTHVTHVVVDAVGGTRPFGCTAQ